MPVADRFTEQVKLYTTELQIDATLNVLPEAAELLRGGIPGNIPRGGRQAEDSALAIGMDATLAAIAYFEVTNANRTDIKNGRVIQDQSGECWVIRGKPAVRARFEETAHIRVLLEFLKVLPDGIA